MNPKLSAGRPTETATKKAATLASLSDKKPMKRINFELDADQHRKLKIYAANQGKSIKDVVNEYIDQITATIE
ncbi:plasmid partition protein ParG [Escherichia coli]|uniref:plasmid partition protein ParG n=1 Tax=Escherichia coli TaxID=562 RepID=UPI0006A6360B|nr:plasmid partition protein ParG [Escherichia coli]